MGGSASAPEARVSREYRRREAERARRIMDPRRYGSPDELPETESAPPVRAPQPSAPAPISPKVAPQPEQPQPEAAAASSAARPEQTVDGIAEHLRSQGEAVGRGSANAILQCDRASEAARQAATLVLAELAEAAAPRGDPSCTVPGCGALMSF